MGAEVGSFGEAEREALEEKNKEPRRNPNKNKPTKLSKTDLGNSRKNVLDKKTIGGKKAEHRLEKAANKEWKSEANKVKKKIKALKSAGEITKEGAEKLAKKELSKKLTGVLLKRALTAIAVMLAAIFGP